MGNTREHKHGKALGLLFLFVFFRFMRFCWLGMGGGMHAVKRRVYFGVGWSMDGFAWTWYGQGRVLARLHACREIIVFCVCSPLVLSSSSLSSSCVLLGLLVGLTTYVLDHAWFLFSYSVRDCHGRRHDTRLGGNWTTTGRRFCFGGFVMTYPSIHPFIESSEMSLMSLFLARRHVMYLHLWLSRHHAWGFA